MTQPYQQQCLPRARPSAATRTESLNLGSHGWHWLLRMRSSLTSRPSARSPDSQGMRVTRWKENRAALITVGDKVLARRGKNDGTVGIVVLDFHDLPDLQITFGKDLTDRFLVVLGRKLHQLAARDGVVERIGATTFAVLLPGLGRQKTLSAVREVLGSPACVEVETRSDDVLLMPHIRIETADEEDDSIAGVLGRMCKGLVQTHPA